MVNVRFPLWARLVHRILSMSRVVSPALASMILIAAAAAQDPEGQALVEQGRTAFVIVHDPSAPASVRAAAAELARVVQISTGATLTISPAPGPRTIYLGDSEHARAQGIIAKELPAEGYRIVIRPDAIFIVGNDTPRNRLGWGGNEETGTLFGTYAFLEKFLGVRWLMPGDVGEDIPKHVTLMLAPADFSNAPYFSSRITAGGTRYTDWLTRNGGGGWHVQHNHNWAGFPARSVLREHPEYMALQRGRRMAVPADDKSPFEPKFCTSNPGLIQAYADAAIAFLQRNPTERFFSLTPSDGGGWCECDDCRKLSPEGPHPKWGDYGRFHRSVTPLILKYYNDVAKIVGQKLPDRVLCGYVYYNFLYPPDAIPKLEPNLSLMIAPLQHYGMTRYKPELRSEFETLCKIWSDANPMMGYYAVSTWMRVGIGAPLGPSLPILKHTYATLKKNKFRVVYSYPLPQGSCGVHNYLVAKLMWNPDADLDALFEEWMQRAYGPGGPAMAELYRLLDREIEAFKIASPLQISDYEMSSEMALRIYAKNFWKIEQLYTRAFAAAQTDAQRARLELFADSMVILHRVLAEAGALENAGKSIFRRTAEEYRAFLEARKDTSVVRIMRNASNEGGITGVVVPKPRVALSPRSLTVPRLREATTPPQIDGDLSDTAWREAASAEQDKSVADRFMLIGGEKAPKNVTRALVTYDEKNLYISFRCADNEITAQDHRPDDMNIFGDDCVQVFFHAGEGEPQWFWHLTVNAANSRWDALTTANGPLNAQVNLDWQSATTTGEGYWAAEIKVPFASIVPPGASSGLTGAPVGQTWRVNLARQDRPTGEASSWSPVEKGFRASLQELGRMYFPR